MKISIKKYCQEISANPEIKSFCDGILPELGVKFFSYCRIYSNKTAVAFTNNSEVAEYMFKNKVAHAFHGLPDMRQSGYYCQDDFPKDNYFAKNVIGDVSVQFDLHHFCYVVFHYRDYIEVGVFAVDKDFHEFNRYFLSNQELFFKFIVCFKDKLKTVIKRGKHAKFKLPAEELTLSENKASTYKETLSNLIKSQKIDRYYLDNIAEELYLTQREAECLKHLKEGMNYYDIAEKLNITRHTVQLHFNNIRAKLNCEGKKELLDRIQDSEILTIVD